MQWPPLISDFKAYFDRGQFPFGETVPAVRDKDIGQAFNEAKTIFNPDIYPDDIKPLALIYLTAHFLATDIAAGGNAMGGAGIQTGRSAGSVSESLQVPEWALKNPMYSELAKTYYGRKYLTMTDTYAVGSVMVVGGATLP